MFEFYMAHIFEGFPCVALVELFLRSNAISNLAEVNHLRDLRFLHTLWLLDNPVVSQPNYRSFVLTALPQLKVLDHSVGHESAAAEDQEEAAEVFSESDADTSGGEVAYRGEVAEDEAVHFGDDDDDDDESEGEVIMHGVRRDRPEEPADASPLLEIDVEASVEVEVEERGAAPRVREPSPVVACLPNSNGESTTAISFSASSAAAWW